MTVTWLFAFFSGVLDWIVLILVWFERYLHSAQDVIFPSEYSRCFNSSWKIKKYSDYSTFRPVKPQITIKIVTQLVISLSIFLFLHCARVAFDKIYLIGTGCVLCQLFVYIIDNCNSLRLSALFYLETFSSPQRANFPSVIQRRFVIYHIWQGFHSRNLAKFFAVRLYCRLCRTCWSGRWMGLDIEWV